MPDDLYDRDALLWAEQQAAVLRRLAAGERVNSDVDWPNVIEEIEDVGRSELHGCENLLLQALVHLLKLRAWPTAIVVAHWRGETVNSLAQARRYFAPSMRRRIDLAVLYCEAVAAVRASEDEDHPQQAILDSCPYSLDDLLSDTPNIRALAAKLDH